MSKRLSWMLVAALAWCGPGLAQSWENHLAAGRQALFAGNAAAALQEFEAAQAKADQAAGARPDDNARIRFFAGVAHFHLGDFARSEASHRAALAILDAAGSSNSEALAAVTHQLASALQNQGNYRDAEPFHRRSLTLTEREPGVDAVTLARALNNLGSALVQLEKHDEALPLLERARALLSKPQSNRDPDLAEVININLADSFRQQGRLAEAEPLYRAVLGKLDTRGNETDMFAAGARLGLAFVLLARGAAAEGEALYDRGLAVYARRLGEDHVIVKKYKDEYSRLQRK